MKPFDTKPRILIVDDQPENIRMLMEVLKDSYATVPATDGEAALEKAATEPAPDLILLDIMMPGLNGYEVCRQLKAQSQTRDIPVIFITAVSEAMDAAFGFEVGAVDYVTKPFNPLTVRGRVATHVQLSRTMKELKDALARVKLLSGLLPICSHCKKIRDDKGYWNQIESYLRDHSEADFSHSICPECARKHYSDLSFPNP